MVAAGTGIISTVAGTGEYGSLGDGGPATSASILSSSPGGVAVDTSGNLFIADGGHGRVRAVRGPLDPGATPNADSPRFIAPGEVQNVTP